MYAPTQKTVQFWDALRPFSKLPITIPQDSFVDRVYLEAVEELKPGEEYIVYGRRYFFLLFVIYYISYDCIFKNLN